MPEDVANFSEPILEYFDCSWPLLWDEVASNMLIFGHFGVIFAIFDPLILLSLFLVRPRKDSPVGCKKRKTIFFCVETSIDYVVIDRFCAHHAIFQLSKLRSRKKIISEKKVTFGAFFCHFGLCTGPPPGDPASKMAKNGQKMAFSVAKK